MTKANDAEATRAQAPSRMPPPLPPPPVPPQMQPGRPPEVNSATSIKQMVKDAYAQKASDIHIRVGQVPRYRIRGQMVEAEGQLKVTPEIFEQNLAEILTPAQRKQFAENKELDTAIFYPGFVRCRVNCFESLMGGAMVLRLISLEIPSLDSLGLPQVLKDIVSKPQGLILVTGPTGSGKSTTLAAMIRHLNETTNKHIVTIEDPIEFVHPSQKCLVSQREVGLHTNEFHAALRSVLREDPDVILIGEMRDRITVNTALQAAQTGHLVLGTLHTRNAINAVNRLLNLYNADEQPAMRIQITDSLVAVIAQLLLPTTDSRRTAVHDILINTPAMQDYLLKGDDEEAYRLMLDDTFDGMQVMNQALYDQMLEGRITLEAALSASPDPNDLDRRIRTGGIDASSSTRTWM
ncbi:type IV pilus twitching motility protein PilT [Coleofasciculus sp. FACHB-712]|uniref:type IV pilus twitching motility protein PilT n=1 Tax=Cyanophyceae TaxID=3028117 RepID=UPI0016827EC8|nr:MULTISPECIES: type IV pilus twitching motility protein PilT [unclassified Coleofasciculus]MBD1841279.1 type IV pilus twitching motility protein PilT [Coleofasciculus sp. FACHB-501]MBD1889104.1 type IV pilus twitching motility protein PilT [Coleofasciculus sp. FACHB-SPT9]MBD1893592.1 type IV pilus twitching motility protein PilT [Coleofasciculus sp. FACHB-129]MBD1901447.1 type IV pilus twitching motility protein PilT [Coleofasciculus sp. FACHB-125]MBD1941204.1 type IV pilus twitching motilit